jgi:hypothetical protein
MSGTYKKNDHISAEKMADSYSKREKQGCASTGNAFTFRYVPAYDFLHMAISIKLLNPILSHQALVKPREDKKF